MFPFIVPDSEKSSVHRGGETAIEGTRSGPPKQITPEGVSPTRRTRTNVYRTRDSPPINQRADAYAKEAQPVFYSVKKPISSRFRSVLPCYQSVRCLPYHGWSKFRMPPSSKRHEDGPRRSEATGGDDSAVQRQYIRRQSRSSRAIRTEAVADAASGRRREGASQS